MSIKSLMYRSNYRGCKESELILGNFARAKLQELTQEQLKEYEDIVSLNDADLMGWIMYGVPLPEEYEDNSVLSMLKEEIGR